MKKKQQTSNLLNTINNNIINTHLLQKNQCVLLSISGGQDSICVFFIFIQLRKQWNWKFGIIFCNHLWQKNTFFTTLLIIQLAYIFKIPIYCTITTNKIFNEYQSRYWRYSIFYRISCFYNYKIITTGHTSSDKIETILFQMIRGSSTKSFSSLNSKKYFLYSNNFSKNSKIQAKSLHNWVELQKITTHKLFYRNYAFRNFTKKNINRKLISLTRFLIRPVLNLHRFDCQKLFNFWSLPIYPDTSNLKTYYSRNRIRKQLLPTLRIFFNPQIDNTLLQFADIISTEQLYLNTLINRLKYEYQKNKNQFFQLNTSLFYGIPLAIQRKLIKKFLENYSCKKIYFFQIEYLIYLIKKNKISIFTKFLKKQKKLKEKYFYFRNNTKINRIEFKWNQLKKKEKQNITVLNFYLINKKVYFFSTWKKILLYKNVKYFKKQFFIYFIYKILVKKRYGNFIYNLNEKKNFLTYLTNFFVIKQKNKTTKKFVKNHFKLVNSFNFKTLTKKFSSNFIEKYRNTNKKKNFPRLLKYNCGNLFHFYYTEIFHFTCFNYSFQKFQIFLYPQIGSVFFFKTLLIILKN